MTETLMQVVEQWTHAYGCPKRTMGAPEDATPLHGNCHRCQIERWAREQFVYWQGFPPQEATLARVLGLPEEGRDGDTKA